MCDRVFDETRQRFFLLSSSSLVMTAGESAARPTTTTTTTDIPPYDDQQQRHCDLMGRRVLAPATAAATLFSAGFPAARVLL